MNLLRGLTLFVAYVYLSFCLIIVCVQGFYDGMSKGLSDVSDPAEVCHEHE